MNNTMIKNEKLMLEDTEILGVDLSEFLDTTADITEHTYTKDISLKDLVLLHINPRTEEKIKTGTMYLNAALNNADANADSCIDEMTMLYRSGKGTKADEYIKKIIEPMNIELYNQFCMKLRKDNEKLFVSILNPEKITREFEPPVERFIVKQSILDKGGTKNLIEEAENETKILILHERQIFFISKDVIRDLGEITGFKGASVMDHSYYRTAEFARKLGEQNGNVGRLIIRNNGLCRKIISIGSLQYGYIPQTFINETIDYLKAELGDVQCEHWQVTPEYSNIFLHFPNKADELKKMYSLPDALIPGVMIETSDSRGSAFKIRSSWQIGSRVTMLDSEFTQQHRFKNLDRSEIMMSIKECVFDRFTILPERLCELMLIDITDPTWESKMSKTEFKKMNRDMINKVLRSCIRESGILKAIHQKRVKELMESLMNEFDFSLNFTAYDLVISLMDVPNRINGLEDKQMIDNLSFACGKVPYCKFEKPAKATVISLV